jgi:hypothetical protein
MHRYWYLTVVSNGKTQIPAWGTRHESFEQSHPRLIKGLWKIVSAVKEWYFFKPVQVNFDRIVYDQHAQLKSRPHDNGLLSI